MASPRSTAQLNEFIDRHSSTTFCIHSWDCIGFALTQNNGQKRKVKNEDAEWMKLLLSASFCFTCCAPLIMMLYKTSLISLSVTEKARQGTFYVRTTVILISTQALPHESSQRMAYWLSDWVKRMERNRRGGGRDEWDERDKWMKRNDANLCNRQFGLLMTFPFMSYIRFLSCPLVLHIKRIKHLHEKKNVGFKI